MDVLSPRPLAAAVGVLALVGLLPLTWGWTSPALAVLVVLAAGAVVVPTVQGARTRAALADAEAARRADLARVLTDLARLEARRD